MVVLTHEEAEERILQLLKENGEMSTQEIEMKGRENDVTCPDGSVKTLTKMKYKGLIKGRLSPEKGGWVWWLPTEGE